MFCNNINAKPSSSCRPLQERCQHSIGKVYDDHDDESLTSSTQWSSRSNIIWTIRAPPPLFNHVLDTEKKLMNRLVRHCCGSVRPWWERTRNLCMLIFTLQRWSHGASCSSLKPQQQLAQQISFSFCSCFLFFFLFSQFVKPIFCTCLDIHLIHYTQSVALLADPVPRICLFYANALLLHFSTYSGREFVHFFTIVVVDVVVLLMDH